MTQKTDHPRTILITGATDGIGLETAKRLVSMGHHVLIHGRAAEKLQKTKRELAALSQAAEIESYAADLSKLSEVESFADEVIRTHKELDVVINNAGVFKTSRPVTEDGFDTRFVVNTISPYLLTKRLLPRLGPHGRVINLSSAAQSPVDLEALAGRKRLADMEAYAQSKLALTMWSRHLALELGDNGPVIIAVNPGSLLASKMVKEGFGVAGKDLSIGANILIRAALDDAFANASGQYFDNDQGRFDAPHPDGLDQNKSEDVVVAIEAIIKQLMQH